MHEVWKRQQVHEDARKMHRAEVCVRKIWGKKRKRHLGGHDLVRSVGRQRDFLVWCRTCSGHARQRMGPKLMDSCKPVLVGTEEHGKMLKRILILEDGRVLAEEAKNWKIEGQKRRITGKESRRLLNEFEMGGFMAQKGVWNLTRAKMRQDRGALPQEEGDEVMHEETFLNSWLREDGEDKQERNMEVDGETKKDMGKKWKKGRGERRT